MPLKKTIRLKGREMNKAEAIKLAKETGCGIQENITSVNPVMYFYCQIDSTFKRRSGHPFAFVTAPVDLVRSLIGDAWIETVRPITASTFIVDGGEKFESGETLVLDNVDIHINGKPMDVTFSLVGMEDAPPFEARPMDTELAMCRRYYKKINKEDKMKVIVKDKNGADVAYRKNVKKAKKWVQKNGAVREKFKIFEEVGTYCVPAPKLKKVK